MNQTDAREAMINRLTAALAGGGADVPTGTVFIEPTTKNTTPAPVNVYVVRGIIISGGQQRTAFKKRWRTRGTFNCSVLCPVNADAARVNVGTLTEVIASAFNGQQDTADLFYRSALVREMPEENNRFVYRVEVAYDLTTRL